MNLFPKEISLTGPNWVFSDPQVQEQYALIWKGARKNWQRQILQDYLQEIVDVMAFTYAEDPVLGGQGWNQYQEMHKLLAEFQQNWDRPSETILVP